MNSDPVPSSAIYDATAAGRNLLTATDVAAQKTLLDLAGTNSGDQDLSGYAAASHAHAAADITSGTFDDAQIAQSNVTQHQAAIVLTERQTVYLSSTKIDAEAALSVIDFDVHEAWSLTAVKFECDKDNPPTGASAQMDIRKNGTSIFSTNPTIDATESSSDTAATAPVLASNPTAISAGDNLDFDLDQIGASDAGRGYYAVLIYTRSNS